VKIKSVVESGEHLGRGEGKNKGFLSGGDLLLAMFRACTAKGPYSLNGETRTKTEGSAAGKINRRGELVNG